MPNVCICTWRLLTRTASIGAGNPNLPRAIVPTVPERTKCIGDKRVAREAGELAIAFVALL